MLCPECFQKIVFTGEPLVLPVLYLSAVRVPFKPAFAELPGDALPIMDFTGGLRQKGSLSQAGGI